MSASHDKPAPDRRRVLAGAVAAACGTGCLALLLGRVAAPARSLAATALRPPGALAEADFLAACVRCGLCVRDCPYDTLRLAELADEAAAGTPYFVARDVPCEMCEDIPCVAACPTGALDHALTDIDDARMGSAVLVGHETCLNALGLRCDVCYRVCPLIDKAITLELRHNERTGRHAYLIPVVHTDVCTGCGKCEASCVLEEAAIKVLPSALARGRIGEHYRLGWEEQQRQGKSLVDGIIDLPDRGYTPPALNGEFRP
ncbi:ferredoxin-type protein NapG [Azospirillum sp. ST 5-10]|uniref:ferredoxin-type protein NapG n=1 Tax=unclassified Azospirillum TaxID=2630922 RepID=UPI003F49D52F